MSERMPVVSLLFLLSLRALQIAFSINVFLPLKYIWLYIDFLLSFPF